MLLVIVITLVDLWIGRDSYQYSSNTSGGYLRQKRLNWTNKTITIQWRTNVFDQDPCETNSIIFSDCPVKKCNKLIPMTSDETADVVSYSTEETTWTHDDVIKWKHFPRYWPFVRRIHRSPVNSPHKGQWRGALMFTLICARINGWVNNCEAGDLRRNRAHYDVIVMRYTFSSLRSQSPIKIDI